MSFQKFFTLKYYSNFFNTRSLKLYEFFRRRRCSYIPIKEEILKLFDSNPTRKFSLYGRHLSALKEVNADPGVTEQVYSSLIDESLKTNGKRVLNVACGMRSQMLMLKELGFDVYGFDIDVKNNTDTIKYHNLNEGGDIPFEPESFDFVICQEIIEHIENPWLLFRKVKKMLKKDGILIVSTPNICSVKNKIQFRRSVYGYSHHFCPDNLWQHINPIPYWEMLYIAQYNGFDKIRITGNHEFYVKYKLHCLGDSQERCTIEENPVLIFVFKKMDSDIKLYSPFSTYLNILSNKVRGCYVSSIEHHSCNALF